MLITTTGGIEGHPVDRYLGIVTGEAVFGVGFLADLKAGFKDVVGGRVESYEKELEAAKDLALAEVTKKSEALGAHAVIGASLSYNEFLGKYFMVVANGTAVLLKDFQEKAFPKDFLMPAVQEDLEKE